MAKIIAQPEKGDHVFLMLAGSEVPLGEGKVAEDLCSDVVNPGDSIGFKSRKQTNLLDGFSMYYRDMTWLQGEAARNYQFSPQEYDVDSETGFWIIKLEVAK